MRTSAFPIVAPGWIKKDSDILIEGIPGNPSLKEIQNILSSTVQHYEEIYLYKLFVILCLFF